MRLGRGEMEKERGRHIVRREGEEIHNSSCGKVAIKEAPHNHTNLSVIQMLNKSYTI